MVLADTHYMLDPGNHPLEFESRRKQTARAEVALNLAAALHTDFIVHLGDLVQEYPETALFQQALNEAQQQMQRCDVQAHHVAGNHDVGDKPDPTMPTHPVTPESLSFYHNLYGPSWYSFNQNDCHFIIINSQILNLDLPETRAQETWLEQDLAAHAGTRLFLFLHLPPFLHDELEAHLGHYDNIGQPARSWLLDLVRRHSVEYMSAAHVHFAFFNRIGRTRLYHLPSTSFTRPGFSHLFAAAPPPEQGRDDTPKLGFHLCRVLPDRTDVHFIRTAGAQNLSNADTECLVTRTSASLPHSPLGLSLLHPLAPATEIPIAYPSIIRQPVRNDYPLLSALELGVTTVRAPWTDLLDPVQQQRLSVLKDEGVSITAIHPWSGRPDFPALIEQHRSLVDEWEIQLPGSPWPTEEILQTLSACRSLSAFSVCPVIPGEGTHPVKQHPRTRIGYRPEELPELNGLLEEADLTLDSILCRLSTTDPSAVVQQLSGLSNLNRIGTINLALDLASIDDGQNATFAARALFNLAGLPNSRLFIEPLLDLDRTMDVSHGLLDTRCNPRPAFHALRCLNTLLYATPLQNPTLSQTRIGTLQIEQLQNRDQMFTLISTLAGEPLPQRLPPVPGTLPETEVRAFDLCAGTVHSGPLKLISDTVFTNGPLLLATTCTPSNQENG
ncbi:MAG: metallophosphoesterase [bacterium]|nr:metallophosphoesterase [bacterium]